MTNREWMARIKANARTPLEALVAVERRVRALRTAGDLEGAVETALAFLSHLESQSTDPSGLEAELAQALDHDAAAPGNLTAKIVHEIRNPLNLVGSFAQLSRQAAQDLALTLRAEEERLSPEVRDEVGELVADLEGNAARINEHVQRASGIVRGMLDHSRGLSGETQPADLGALFEESLRLVSDAQPGARPVHIEREFDEGVRPLAVVPQSLGQVLRNLIHNALYAVRARAETAPSDFQPTLWLSTRESEGYLHLGVRDNGGGIPPETLAKVLRPFFSTKPVGKGTGLGLAISHEIVTRLHGGEMRVESDGGFTTVWVVLPRGTES
jgi:two-component system NtrC family sensor kinase